MRNEQMQKFNLSNFYRWINNNKGLLEEYGLAKDVASADKLSRRPIVFYDQNGKKKELSYDLDIDFFIKGNTVGAYFGSEDQIIFIEKNKGVEDEYVVKSISGVKGHGKSDARWEELTAYEFDELELFEVKI